MGIRYGYSFYLFLGLECLGLEETIFIKEEIEIFVFDQREIYKYLLFLFCLFLNMYIVRKNQCFYVYYK